jgi:hypothetical protein
MPHSFYFRKPEDHLFAVDIAFPPTFSQSIGQVLPVLMNKEYLLTRMMNTFLTNNKTPQAKNQAW